MSAPGKSTPAVSTPTFFNWVLPLLAALVLTVAMMQFPAAPEADAASSYQSLLLEASQTGQIWGRDLITNDGPLAAFQQPITTRNNFDRLLGWQWGINFILATMLVIFVTRLERPLRWWAMAGLVVGLTRSPSLAPWLAAYLVGWNLLANPSSKLLLRCWYASCLGALAVFSIAHFLVGILALVLSQANRQSSDQRWLPFVAYASGFAVIWLAVGQSLSASIIWLGNALPVTWHTSALLRTVDISHLKFWALIASSLLLVRLVWIWMTTPVRRDFAPAAIFIMLSLVIAWKGIALQPFGNPGAFFVTILATAGVLTTLSGHRFAQAPIALVALIGFWQWEPRLFTDGLGHVNRQLTHNLQQFGSLATLPQRQQGQIEQAKQPYVLPQVHAIIGSARLDFLGSWPYEGLLGGWQHLRNHPAPMSPLIRSAAVIDLIQPSKQEKDSPFILQRFQTINGIVPAQDNPTSQLELYQGYDAVLVEKGFILWQKRAEKKADAVLVHSGQLRWNEPLSLPVNNSNHGYWLELDVSATWFGTLFSWLDELTEPGLLVRDAEGHATYHTLQSATAGRGFLIDPYLRGEGDLLQMQTGVPLARSTDVTVIQPPSGSRWWKPIITYRLFSLPDFKSTQAGIPPSIFDVYQMLNRRPVATTASIPIGLLPGDHGGIVLFAHPDSTLEFAITANDRRLKASFTIRQDAIVGKNSTDGVDFAVEYISPTGQRRVLFHRYLDPLLEPQDRGLQNIEITLPQQPGRLLLRTYNPPDRNRAWDWSYWSSLTIE